MPKYIKKERIQVYEDSLNSNEAYAKAASWWTGDFVFIVRASGNLDHDLISFIGLSHGKCTGVRMLSSEDEFIVVGPDDSTASTDKIPVEYVYEAEYDTWLQILKGELDPIRALLSGKAKIQGEMAKVLKATDAAKELVRTGTLIETEFY
jgi:putative sterol carrier protein